MKINFLLILIAFFIFFMGTAGAEEAAPSPAPALASITVLDLQTAQKIALQNNPDIAVAMSRIEQAKARIDQAGAAWLPSLDIGMTGSRT